MNSITNPVAAVDQAFYYIIGISVCLLLFITLLMIYFVIRYRKSRHPSPKDIRGNFWLEFFWMIVPTAIALSMFYVGWHSYLSLRNVPENALNIDVLAQMFSWQFTYPNGKVSENLLVVPQDQAIKLNITSKDVIHSLSIPAFRIKVDAVRGMHTYAWFQADPKGHYKAFCTEFCGSGHSDMTADVRIVPKEEYRKWLKAAPEEAEVAESDTLSADQYAAIDFSQFKKIDGKMAFWWSIQGDTLRIRLSAKATGWLGIGFNPSRSMRGANFILGAVDNGRVVVVDHFGVGATRHKADIDLGGKKSIRNTFGKEADGVTEIYFEMPIHSDDQMDSDLQLEGKTIVLLAYNNVQDSFKAKHMFKTAFQVNLSSGAYKTVQW